MPKHVADELYALSLEGFVSFHGLTHLRVRRHGTLLVLESGPKDAPVPHARFRRAGAHLWWLEIATHKERWEKTGFRGQIHDLSALLVTDFPWVLTPIA